MILFKSSKLFVANLSISFILVILIFLYPSTWEYKTVGFGKVKALLKLAH